MSQNLYKLPKEWVWKDFSAVAKIQSGTGFPKAYQGIIDAEIPFLKVGDMNLPGNETSILHWNHSISHVTAQAIKAKVMPAGTVIFPKIGGAIATNKKRKLTKLSAYDNNVMGLQAMGNLSNDYLFWYLQGINLSDWASASALPSMKASTIKEHKIPTPPLAEQERIVEKLDALFSRIDTATAHLNKTLQHAKALFASALNEEFSALIGKSQVKPFGDVIDNYDGKRIPIKASERKTTNGDYPYYGATGIIDYVDGFIFDGERLLISEDGANLVARKYPIAFIATGKYWVNNHAHIVDAKPELTTNHYLETYFAWVNLDPYITGAAQPKLSQKKLNTIPIPLPPLEEQKRIAAHLDGLSERVQTLEKTTCERIDHLSALKASLLDDAFRGKL